MLRNCAPQASLQSVVSSITVATAIPCIGATPGAAVRPDRTPCLRVDCGVEWGCFAVSPQISQALHKQPPRPPCDQLVRPSAWTAPYMLRVGPLARCHRVRPTCPAVEGVGSRRVIPAACRVPSSPPPRCCRPLPPLRFAHSRRRVCGRGCRFVGAPMQHVACLVRHVRSEVGCGPCRQRRLKEVLDSSRPRLACSGGGVCADGGASLFCVSTILAWIVGGRRADVDAVRRVACDCVCREGGMPPTQCVLRRRQKLQ